MSPERRPPDATDEFLTVAEVASIKSLISRRFATGSNQGSLPALRVGRRVRVLRRDLDQLLADAQAPSRVEQRTVTDESDTHQGGVMPSSSGAANSPHHPALDNLIM